MPLDATTFQPAPSPVSSARREAEGVDRIGAYRFAIRDARLLETYFDRLAEAGVKPRSGSCPERAGEVAYIPGDRQAATSAPYR